MSILSTLLLLQISAVQSAFNSALSEKQSDEFYKAVLGFVGIIVIAAPLFALNEYIDSRISIEWRSWMASRLISSYFADLAYFRLKMANSKAIDNPDQRMCEDVRSFTSSSVILAVGILRQMFYCVAFSGLLATLAPGLVGFLLVYALLGTWVTAGVFGRPLTALAFHVLEKEADLRFDLVRVRENAESVAFYGADGRESRIAAGRLDTAVAVTRKQILIHAWLSLWQNMYSYATILIPSLLMAPRYFAGDVRFGTIVQVGFAFSKIEGALSYIVTHLAALSNLAAETERLDALMRAVAPDPRGGGVKRTILTIPSGGSSGGNSLSRNGNMNRSGSSFNRSTSKIVSIEGKPTTTANEDGGGDDNKAANGLVIQSLHLTTPHGEKIICTDLSFSLSPGDSLLIVGPSGVGKSSLMRAVAGLWSTGSGTISTPPPSELFFLPQKPYMPLGTLRQQLCFPDEPLQTVTEDENLKKLLTSACLPDLFTRVGGLDAECDWSYMLSLGEQQRVAFLRLLRRCPAVAFLDESTSGVDSGTENKLYAALQSACSCYISIGHRKELLAHHTHVLEAAGEGKWVLQTARQYQQRV
jgi:vitamin B12/bleomycin/antimicrobial peptide transport system ATP-binding/permease protein